MSDSENIRDLKRPYRKKALQSGYSQAADGVDAYPPPISSVSTTTTQQTQVVRPGIDPATYKRDVRPAVEFLERSVGVNYANYPWHLVPKSDSSNLIQRQNVNLTTILQPGGAATSNFLDSGQFVDLIVINANDDNIPTMMTPRSGLMPQRLKCLYALQQRTPWSPRPL